MENETLTSDNLQEIAESFRALARVTTKRILKLQIEVRDLVNAGASQTDIDAKRDEIALANSKVSQCFAKAIELDTKAALDILTSTDVTNAVAALVCTTAKVQLAVDRLNQIRTALRFLTAFIDIGGAIGTLSVPGGTVLASIKALIEKIDNLSQIEVANLPINERQGLDRLLTSCIQNEDEN